jgi:hypothetical protein
MFPVNVVGGMKAKRIARHSGLVEISLPVCLSAGRTLGKEFRAMA